MNIKHLLSNQWSLTPLINYVTPLIMHSLLKNV